MHNKNYLDHCISNPTKNISQAVVGLYEVIDGLGGYVSGGVTDDDFGFARSIHEQLVSSNVLSQDSQRMFDLMINRVEEKRNDGEVPEGSGLCFIMSPDNSRFIVVDVPPRPQPAW